LAKWSEGKPQLDVRVALDRLRKSVTEVYLHININSMNSKFAPSVMFDPVPGGISLEDMEDAIARGAFDRFRVTCRTRGRSRDGAT
jgi:arginase family enzyme